MIKNWLNNFIEAGSDSDAAEALDIDRVTIHLLVEVARADYSIESEELQAVIEAATKASALERSEVEEIVQSALSEVDDNISYHAHVAFINKEFSLEQKRSLLERMWRIAYADKHIDKYEEAFIRRFADLIYMKHKEFMQAKHRAIS